MSAAYVVIEPGTTVIKGKYWTPIWEVACEIALQLGGVVTNESWLRSKLGHGSEPLANLTKLGEPRKAGAGVKPAEARAILAKAMPRRHLVQERAERGAA